MTASPISDQHTKIDRMLCLFRAAQNLTDPKQVLPEPRYLTECPNIEFPIYTADAALAWMGENAAGHLEAMILAQLLDEPVMTWQLVDAAEPHLATRASYEHAELVHTLGVRAAHACQDPQARARMRTYRGKRRLASGHPTDALTDFEEASYAFEEIDDRPGAARTMHYQAAAHLAAGDLPRGEMLATQAIEQSMLAGDEATAALAQLTRAEVSLERHQYETAARDAQNAHTVFVALRDEPNSARTQIALARAHTGLGHLDDADELLIKADTALRHHSYDLARLYMARADIANMRADRHDDPEWNQRQAALLRRSASDICVALAVPLFRWPSPTTRNPA